MQETKETLKKLGLSDKEIGVYLTLLSLGPSSVRKIAAAADINRGTTYDALKTLEKSGLVSYYHKEKHQFFTAEDPKALKSVAERKKQDLEEIAKHAEAIIPELRSLWNAIEERPVVKYYEGHDGIKTILQNVLDTVEETKEKEYAIYSSADIRPHLYKKFPNFTEERIKRNIFVRAIAIGAGGKESGNDERRWLTKTGGLPTYTFIYAGKLAMISLDKNKKPRGVIIEDKNLFETQKILFDYLWKTLK